MNVFPLNISGNANLVKFLRLFLRFFVPLAAVCFLVYSLIDVPQEVFVLWKSKIKFSLTEYLMLAALVMLAVINWSMEAMKWKLLCGKIEVVPFWKAFYAVLYGTTVGMITPRRSGEFLGRVMILRNEKRLEGMMINLAGSLSQLFVTFATGLFSVFFVVRTFSPAADFSFSFTFSYWYFIFLIAILTLFVLVFQKRIINGRTGIIFKNMGKKLKVFRKIGRGEIFSLLAWSMLRYMVFIMQFYLILRLLQVPLDLTFSFLLLSITYLFLSPLPVSAIVEAGVRGSVILLVFDIFFSDVLNVEAAEISLVAAMFLLWIVNLAFPAITGAFIGIRGRSLLE